MVRIFVMLMILQYESGLDARHLSEAEMLQWKTKIGQDVLSLQKERSQLQREVGELRFKYNEMKKFIEDLASIARLEEIYQVAKETKDAATMDSVNKSMYYAIRNAKRKETNQ